jgi:flavin-binding protein dodecin
MSCYKVIDLIGTSEISWDDAARNAIDAAAQSLHDLRIAEVKKMDIKVQNGEVIYRTRLELSFKYVEKA